MLVKEKTHDLFFQHDWFTWDWGFRSPLGAWIQKLEGWAHFVALQELTTRLRKRQKQSAQNQRPEEVHTAHDHRETNEKFGEKFNFSITRHEPCPDSDSVKSTLVVSVLLFGHSSPQTILLVVFLQISTDPGYQELNRRSALDMSSLHAPGVFFYKLCFHWRHAQLMGCQFCTEARTCCVL